MATRAVGAASVLVLGGCELAYPEIAITNRTAEPVELRALSFNGCAWDGVLGFGETTSVGRCLPGEDRVHFEKLDPETYCREQAEDGTLDGMCPCSDGTSRANRDPGLTTTAPTWFSYQTISVRAADYGEFQLFEIELDDMEQDFSVPGPYGH